MATYKEKVVLLQRGKMLQMRNTSEKVGMQKAVIKTSVFADDESTLYELRLLTNCINIGETVFYQMLIIFKTAVGPKTTIR